MKNKKIITIGVLSLGAVALLIMVRTSMPDSSRKASVLTAQVFTGEPTPAPQPPPPPPPPPPPAPLPAPAPRRTPQPRPAAPPSPPAEETPAPEIQIAYLLDSDSDGFSDRIESQSETDPQDNNSHPADENRNEIDDAWEQRYGLIPDNGMEDNDRDGLSDKLEYIYGTDPLKEDSDNDTFTDAEEVLELRTNPNDAADPGTLEKLGLRITNFDDNQLISDPQPFIKGTAPKDSTVEITAIDELKQERILGQTLTHDNNIFFFLTPELLDDGEYDLVARVIQAVPLATLTTVDVARAQDPDATQEKPLIVMESKPVHVKINKALGVIPPNPKKLADKEVTAENLIKDLRVKIIDNQPVLFGRTAFNSEVVATWHSIVLTSALIADTPKGEFSISAFHPLGEGNHEVYVQSLRLKDNAVSKTIKVPFTIVREKPVEAIEPTGGATRETQEAPKAPEKLKPAAPELPAPPPAPESSPYAPYFWYVAGLAALAILCNILLALRLLRKKKSGAAAPTEKTAQKIPPPAPPKPLGKSGNGSAHFLQ